MHASRAVEARAAHRAAPSPAVRAGAAILAVVVLACLVGGGWAIWSTDAAGVPRYEAQDLAAALLGPMQRDASGVLHPLGTDRLGRDLLARCCIGGCISLLVGLCAAAVSVGVGTMWGAVSAEAGGRIDGVMMRIVDVLYGLPTILLVVLIAVAADGAMERSGIRPGPFARQALDLAILVAAIGGLSWLTVARVIRGQVLSLKARPFMESCTAIGMGRARRFWLHLVPNLSGPIVVYAALAVPTAILSESFLSFLGLGVREPLPSWGNLAAAGLPELNPVVSRWWLLVFPCLLIALTLLALNLVGDWVRDRLAGR
ncbi:MAG: ABC transporter permease [Phycisphaerales bacterium]